MNPVRVLVVDDEPALAMVTGIFLKERRNYTCEICTSARDALGKLESSTFDIIVSDYQMPGMDGIEFLKAVRARFAHIPFILLTGHSREEVAIEALNCGADFYLQKGVDPETQYAELDHMIRRAVEGKRSQEALRHAEYLKQIILDNVTENVIFQDPECRIIWANRAAQYSAGNVGEEIAGRLCYEVMHKRSKPCEDCPALKAMKSGEPQVALRSSHVLGEWIMRCTPVRDAKGKVIGVVKTGLEVTALKDLESERMQSKEQLDLAVEAARLAVWDWYPGEQKLLYNDTYATMLGYAPEELEVRDGTIAHMVHPEDLPATERDLHEHFAEKTPYAKTEFRIRCRDGTWKWIYASGKVVERNDDGAPRRMVGVHQDITDCKTMEQTLRESEQRLKTAIEGAEICVWDMNLRTGCMRNTDNIAGILGYTPEELEAAGKNPQTWVHSADLAGVQAALAGNLSGKTEFADSTFRLKCRDGTWKWFSARGRTVEGDAQGTPVRRLGILQNIDHIVRARDELHESEQTLRTLLDALVEPALLLDKDGLIQAANSAILERMGVSREKAHNHCVYDFLPPENARIRKHNINEVISTGKPAYFEDERAGMVLQHRIYPVVGRDGSIDSVAAIAYDVTENREQAERFKKSEERLALALAAAEEGFVDWNVPGDEHYWSPHYFTMLGYTPNEFSPSYATWRSLVHPDDLERAEGLLNGLFEGRGDSSATEYRMKTKSGGWLWIRSDVKVTGRDTTGAPLRIVGTHKDISTKKQLEAQIIAGRDLAFGLAGASSLEEAFSLCISYAMDISGLDCGGLFLYDESAGKLDLAYTVGLSDTFVRKEKEKTRNHRRIRKVLQGGPLYPGMADLDSYHRQLLEEEGIRAVVILPILFEERPIGCINIASHTRDEIPEECRKALEAMTAEIGGAIVRIQAREALGKSNEALKSTNHALNLLSSITRHDILNQVSALKAYLILLEEETLESPSSQELCKQMKEIADTIRRQITFTGDYQQMGEKDPEWQHVEWAMKRAAEGTRMNGIQLDVTTGPLEIFADPMLEKAFFNLLENSVSHGQRVSRINVAFCERDGHGLLILEDDGVGIPIDMKPQIFEKGVGSKTGYGLFLVKEIIEITGMTIREAGGEGKGARFEIDIPEGKWRAGSLSP